jgi:plasmid stabilization system protein ParE
MRIKIIWTPKALQTFDDNINYLIDEWNQSVIDDFLLRTDMVLDIIRGDPKLFPAYKSNKVIRKAVVTKQSSFSIG